MPDRLEQLVESDPRFRVEAYLFVFESLREAQRIHQRSKHVSARELLDGFRELARSRFGLMARKVLSSWGLNCTRDVGAVVFNLVNSGLMSKTDEDSVEDFEGVFEFETAFVRDYRIPDAPKRGN
ncbi:hypothetical protein JXB37_06430 [candidate division WOR-3 bacterium]|nr:hypothetical protein [candidate division WOR-3 bacterium]